MQPPHDTEAEEAVVAAMLVSEAAVHELAGRLTAKDFYVPHCREIYSACMDIYARGEAVNPVTVGHRLATLNKLEEAGGMAEMTRMIAMLPTAEGAGFYAGIVREMATRRNLISIAARAERLAVGEAPVEQAVAQVESYIHQLRQARRLGPATVGPEKNAEAWDRIVAFMDSPGKIRGLEMGWGEIDRALNGLVDGRLITVGAATSVGKSLFQQNVIRQLAIRGIPTLMFTTEMTADEVRERLVFMHASVDRLGVSKRGESTSFERDQVFQAIADVREWPVWYCEQAHPTPAVIMAEVRRAKELHGIQAVFVDHLGYVEGRGDSERDRITDAVATLKGVAQDENLPVVATSHVNRAGAGSGDWLKLTDLHGASAIEKDSDQVLLMTPCGYQNGSWLPLTSAEIRAAKEAGRFQLGIELAKNRHGGYAMEYMVVDWQRQGGRFVPMERAA